MAYNPLRSVAAANAACDAMAVLVNSGSIKIYSLGSGIPAHVADTITDQVLLATLPLSATAFGGASDGVATANAITDDSDADQTGTAAFFRACNSGGTAVFQGTVGTAGCDLNLSTISIVQHATVSVSSWTLTEGGI